MKRISRILSAFLAVIMLITCADFAALAEAVLKLPKALKVIDVEAFYGDQSIDKVVVPDGTTEIRARAFANSSLSEINLPDSLTFIDESAFNGPDKVTVTVNPGTYAYDWAVAHDYIDDAALRVSVTCSVDSAVPEESVTWTAEGANGVEPYKYRFYLYCDGERLATRAYNADPTYTYKFTKAGTYYVLVSLKDDDGEIVETQSSDIIVSLETLKVNSVVCDKETIRTTDTAMWTASAVGGEQPYQYQFLLKCGSETVQTQEYSTADTFSYTFEIAGDYSLEVTAKDNLNTVSAAYSVPFTVILRPVEISKITANVNSAVTESAITWTVETVAGKAPFTYDYEVTLDGVTKAKETGLTENSFTENMEYVSSLITDATMRAHFDSWRNADNNPYNEGYLLQEFTYDAMQNNGLSEDSLAWKAKDALWIVQSYGVAGAWMGVDKKLSEQTKEWYENQKKGFDDIVAKNKLTIENFYVPK